MTRMMIGILLVVALLVGDVGMAWAGPGRDISTAHGAYQGQWRYRLTEKERKEAGNPGDRVVTAETIDKTSVYFIPTIAAETYKSDGYFTVLVNHSGGSPSYRLVVFQNVERTKMLECLFLGQGNGYGCLAMDYVGPVSKPAP